MNLRKNDLRKKYQKMKKKNFQKADFKTNKPHKSQKKFLKSFISRGQSWFFDHQKV